MVKKIAAKKPIKHSQTVKVKKEEKPVSEKTAATPVEQLPEPVETTQSSVIQPAPLVITNDQSNKPPEVAFTTTKTDVDQMISSNSNSAMNPVQPITQAVPEQGVTTENPSLQPSSQPTTNPVIGQASEDFEPEGKGGGILKVLLIFLTALLVGGGAVAGFFYFSQSQKPIENIPAPTQTPITPSPTVTDDQEASESAKIEDFSVLKVQILNGSGTAGEASRVEGLLQKTKLKTFTLGNADTYNYTDTEVQIKEGVSASVFETIQQTLSEYTTVEETALPKTSDYDIIITIGQRK